ncbi:MAG: hypothetical protein ACYC61_20790 [Isosphaeraceae bacterium]
MGRRFLYILGILFFSPPALVLVPARAQDPGGPPPVEAAPPASGELPPVKPSEIPDLAVPAAPDEPASAQRTTTGPASKTGRGDDGVPGLTLPKRLEPAEPPAEIPSNGRGGRRDGTGRAMLDPSLERAQGSAPAAVGAADRAERTSLDRLPTGRQSVSVTVDIQSPVHINLHKPATLRLIVRNAGTSDAHQVVVHDELPEGLKFVSSIPPPAAGGAGGQAITWSLGTMAAGSEGIITLKVEPTRAGPLEHGASVTFQTGSRARIEVLQPKLKIELVPSSKTVLKGQEVEFKVVVTNVGNGPARRVTVAAQLSRGFRYDQSERGTGTMVTEPIPVLGPGDSKEIDPLVAVAGKAGDETCTVTAHSPDVVVLDKSQEARAVEKITVQEPALDLALEGPRRRCTDTIAQYEIALKNPGTAPARRVRVAAFVPPGLRLTSVPKGARYDASSRRLIWTIDRLEPAPKPQKLAFEVKVGDVGNYEITAEAAADSNIRKKQNLVTEVFGIPDVDLEVTERQRVVDVGGTTHFQIALRNKGTKEATNIHLWAVVSKNLKVTGGLDVPQDLQFVASKDEGEVVLQDKNDPKRGIASLGPGRELVLGIEVKAIADKPESASCRVFITHDSLTEPFEAMARVRILPATGRTTQLGGQ